MINSYLVKFTNEQKMSVDFRQEGFTVDFGPGMPTGDYSGPYTVTPSTETQILYTRNKHVDGDITVEAIPSNYGRLEWNGIRLMVY